jgi:hypothetical protein
VYEYSGCVESVSFIIIKLFVLLQFTARAQSVWIQRGLVCVCYLQCVLSSVVTL